jgi:hemolysin III
MGRTQTIQEERINTLTHGLMAILLIGALPFTIRKFLNHGGAAAWRDTAAVIVFCLCLILMFSSSAIYHGLPQESRFKRLFNRFDHMAIYFAIAGSYTPIAISVIGGRTGLIVLLIQWFLVLAGILFQIFVFNKNLLTQIVSVTLYLAMGCLLLADSRRRPVLHNWRSLLCSQRPFLPRHLALFRQCRCHQPLYRDCLFPEAIIEV